jgi:hypothetical protein
MSPARNGDNCVPQPSILVSATGYSVFSHQHPGEDILASKKADVLFKAVDEFCAEMPEKTIADAAVELALHLLNKASPE